VKVKIRAKARGRLLVKLGRAAICRIRQNFVVLVRQSIRVSCIVPFTLSQLGWASNLKARSLRSQFESF